MLTKHVATSATTAACAGFNAGWVGKRPLQGATASLLPKMTHDPAYSTKGLTASAISVTEQLGYKNKALSGSVQRRKRCLATVVHEQLKWTLVDHSPEQSETECLCVEAAGYKIINLYKPPTSQLTPKANPMFPHLSLCASDCNSSRTPAAKRRAPSTSALIRPSHLFPA